MARQLALWMGWVQGRDTSYWSNAEKIRYLGVRLANKPEQEQFDWLPVARELISLGVPATQIIAAEVDFRTGLVLGRGLYVWGFMYWTTTPAATLLLFDSLPKNSKGFETARKRLGRAVLSKDGWLYQ